VGWEEQSVDKVDVEGGVGGTRVREGWDEEGEMKRGDFGGWNHIGRIGNWCCR